MVCAQFMLNINKRIDCERFQNTLGRHANFARWLTGG